MPDPSPYKRRKTTRVIRNLWVYRRLVLAAFILGVLLWFIVINNTPVTIAFPFRLGSIATTSGLAMLLGALGGAVVAVLILTYFIAVRRLRGSGGGAGVADYDRSALPEDRPPSDYASKTTEGFSDAPWSAR